jgi:hypothetical protein
LQAAPGGGVVIVMHAERAPLPRAALLAAIAVLCIFSLRTNDSKRRTVDSAAETEVVQAIQDAQAAREKLEIVMWRLDQIDMRIARATEAVTGADNDTGRAAAEARLRQLIEERDELLQRARVSRALADRGDRLKCVCVPRQCIDNPLAKGC